MSVILYTILVHTHIKRRANIYEKRFAILANHDLLILTEKKNMTEFIFTERNPFTDTLKNDAWGNFKSEILNNEIAKERRRKKNYILIESF